MKMEVPQVDLPLEVLAWTKVTEDILNRLMETFMVPSVQMAKIHACSRHDCL